MNSRCVVARIAHDLAVFATRLARTGDDKVLALRPPAHDFDLPLVIDEPADFLARVLTAATHALRVAGIGSTNSSETRDENCNGRHFESHGGLPSYECGAIPFALE